MWIRDPIKRVHQHIQYYNSINSLSSAEHDTADPTSHYDNSHHISTDSEYDNIVCDISVQADEPRLCQAKQAHDVVLGKADASLVNKFLTTSDAPHLDTKALIQKLDEVAKAADLDVSTILAEQLMDLLLGTVRSWIRKNTPPPLPILSHHKSNGLKVSYDIVKNSRLLIEEKGQFRRYSEPLDKLEEQNLRICLPLSLFLGCFRLGH